MSNRERALEQVGLRASQLDALHLPQSSFIQWVSLRDPSQLLPLVTSSAVNALVQSKHDYVKAQAMLRSNFMQATTLRANGP
jgi:hypothetical protein